MPNLYMYDGAYRPKLADVLAKGGIALNGYLTGIYANTTTQPQQARAAGLGFVPTYEEGPGELVGASRATGRRVGDKIVKAFKDKGIPLSPDIGVYPSVDVSVPIDGNDRDADQCNTGWLGIRDVIDGSISIRSYAEGAIIDALAKEKLVDGKCWLAAPTSWPGFNVNDQYICMVQLVGTDVTGTDKNHLITDPYDMGAWWPDGSIYERNFMSDLTAAQLKQISDAVWGHLIPIDNQPKPTQWTADHTLQRAYTQAEAARVQGNPSNLAKAIVAALPANVGDLTPAQLEAAIETGVRAVFADAGNPTP